MRVATKILEKEVQDELRTRVIETRNVEGG